MDFGFGGRFTQFEIRFFALLALTLAVSWYWPLVGNRLFVAIERWGSHVAAHRTACWIAMGILLLASRLVLLPIEKPPLPTIHDEVSYLLAADTFAHGRLTNPTPPHWVFFETVFENMTPTYMSKYPPAQGAVLAAGQLLGHPWIGVLLSVAAMCSAITWMLQAWVPARWALLGGMLVVTRFFFAFGYDMNYWLESYWGGAVAATAGALALGALPRLLRRPEWHCGLVLGAGAAIMLCSRPYEGSVLCVVLAAAILWRAWRAGSRWEPLMRPMTAAACVLVAAGAFLAYYNWRGTGNPLLLPYVVNDATYQSTPNFVWQSLRPPMQYHNAQFDRVFNGWLRDVWVRDRLSLTPNGIRWGLLRKLNLLQEFYFPGVLGFVTLVTLIPLIRNRKALFLLSVCGATLAAVLLVVAFHVHYAAPATAAAIALSVFGLRYLRTWTPRGRPVGLGMSRALLTLNLVLIPLNMWSSYSPAEHSIQDLSHEWVRNRQQIERRLESTGGEHLVLVRYDSNHKITEEWVYNHADIGNSKVVWARDIPGEDLRPLLDSFKNRRIWLLEPDARPIRLQPFSAAAAP